MNKQDNKFMTEGYNLLTKKNPKFPKHFTIEMKENLYNEIILYFTQTENFGYCTQLSQSLNKLKNETNK